jgi:PiT family inorganic phosphate transporter
VGVFVKTAPFGLNQQALFFIGGVAIAIGVMTYSKRVMLTVGKSVFKLSPVGAFIVVLSSALVLFVFSSEGLNGILSTLNLPQIPLVPVSQSQAVVGAIMGIAFAKGGRNLNYQVLYKIVLGWVLTPTVSIGVTWILLWISSQM